LGGGLAESTRSWYCEQIKRIIKKYGKASVPTILAEMRRIPQQRYPIQEERIVAFLKYLRYMGEIKYSKSPTRKISSKWELENIHNERKS